MSAKDKVNILIVDDKPTRLLTYEAMLEDLGENLIKAHSGREALQLVMKEDFAVILLDVNMPGLDGFETATLIHQHPRFEKTPIIFVTAVHVTDLDRLKGYKLGAVDYVYIPVVPEILRSKVAVLVELHRKRRELQRLNRSLELANEELARASRVKSEFLANMSHEIRTPLNAIVGMTELVLDADCTSDQRECLASVKTSAESLIVIVNDILDLSRIEAGKFDLDPIDFRLRESLAEALKSLAIHAREKGLPLTSRVDSDVPDALTGDWNRLQQVIINLVANALKFTSQGEVIIRATSDEQTPKEIMLHVTVSDTGIGVPPDKVEMIFAPFTQVDGSVTRKFGGTGLGLTICKRLVEMMGGRIWVASELGQGSTFHFTVRLAVQASANADLSGRDNSKEQSLCSAESTGEAANGTSEPLDILLVEDNVLNQVVATRLLNRKGHRVEIAASGKQALAALERHSFDVILMDVQMPEMDGLEATRTIREMEKATGQHVLIIAQTAHAMEGDQERCLAAGMDGYLSKPIHAERLWRAIRPHAGNRAQSSRR